MQAFILALHVVVCIVLVVIVLLQSGKEGMGVIFGGGSGSLFGGSGAGGLLTKVTTVVATLFLVTSLSYTYLTREQHVEATSVMDQAVQQQLDEQEAAAPAPEESQQGIQVDTEQQDSASGIQVESAAEADDGQAATDETQ